MVRTRDFTEYLRKQQLANDPELESLVEEEAINSHIASQIYSLRKEAGLSQKQLAEACETHQSVIARLEDAEYEGHSLTMLRRIARVLKRRVRVEFYATQEPPSSHQTITFEASKTSETPQTKTFRYEMKVHQEA